RKPDMMVLVLGIFPTAREPDDPIRDQVRQTNEAIASLADGKAVFYKDIGGHFLQADCTLSREVMHDYVHLSAKGYAIWVEAIRADPEPMVRRGQPGEKQPLPPCPLP